MKFTISRKQLPLLPSYAYTDYKSQGQSLESVIVDLVGCKMTQSLYVMLSRVKSLEGLTVLYPFQAAQISRPLSHEYRVELDHLKNLSVTTEQRYNNCHCIPATASKDNARRVCHFWSHSNNIETCHKSSIIERMAEQLHTFIKQIYYMGSVVPSL